MSRYDRITPEGTRDRIFADCEIQNEIIQILRDLYRKEGFREVATPGLEFIDVFTKKQSYYPQEAMYKMTDNKGRLITMRPDSTIPIARLVATKLQNHELPIKLFYAQSVYRQQKDFMGRSNEIMQMGIEFIGSKGFDADINTLKLAMQSLSLACKSPYRLEVGHVGIYNLLIADLCAGYEEEEKIKRYVATKNYGALNDILEKYLSSRESGVKESASVLKELPALFGNKDAISQARELALKYKKELLEMIDYLESVYDELKKNTPDENIMIDFGLVNQADYYTSLVFHGYIESAGEPILSGGRYDNLFKDFDKDYPSTGFGINIDLLVAARQDKPGRKISDDSRLRIALTKGRLEKQFVKLLQESGFDTSVLEEKGRKLLLEIPGSNIEVVLAKADDVITYVEHGVCDVGIVGKDTIAEKGGTFYEIMDLGIGKCKFALAAPKGIDFFKAIGSRSIATKYPKVAQDYFESKGMDIRIIKIEGSVELAPLLSLADGIVDLVETGATLRENGLEVIENIKDISARCIINIRSMKLKKDEIHEFRDKLL